MSTTTTRRPARLLGLIGGLAVGALALAGCAPAAAPADDGVLRIVTTTTQLDDFAKELVAGTGAEVTSLLQPGVSAHSFEPGPADLEALRKADVVVSNGLGLEPWLDSVLVSAEFEGDVIDASVGFNPDDPHAGHDHAADAHADETGAPEEHATEEHADDAHSADDGHNHGDLNPHLWTAPANAELMVTNIANGLGEADPAQASTYTANAETYSAKLDELDAWIRANIDTVPAADRLLVTNHDALHYFNEEYGVTFVGSIMPSWDDSAEPSAAQIEELVAAMEAANVPAIFTEQQLSPTTAEAIASQTGAKVYSGDQALLTDALGAPGTLGATYLGSQVHNVTQLLDSWGKTVIAPPASLNLE